MTKNIRLQAHETSDSSDASALGLMRRRGPLAVPELSQAMAVTATAVRQRLRRLMSEGLVERKLVRSGRGRPSHKYSLTEQGIRACGTNYEDLAAVLWKEVRAIKDPKVRRGLLGRIVGHLAADYGSKLAGETLAEKMRSLTELFSERDVPLVVDESGKLPVLTALACPYPDLAQQDRSVCAMERMLFSELVGEGLKLTGCRLDGASCCTFEAG